MLGYEACCVKMNSGLQSACSWSRFYETVLAAKFGQIYACKKLTVMALKYRKFQIIFHKNHANMSILLYTFMDGSFPKILGYKFLPESFRPIRRVIKLIPVRFLFFPFVFFKRSNDSSKRRRKRFESPCQKISSFSMNTLIINSWELTTRHSSFLII
jgi:hypothetical protein